MRTYDPQQLKLPWPGQAQIVLSVPTLLVF